MYSASAGAAREQGFGVVPDPIDPPRQPIDPAHTLVKAAPEWTKGDRKRRMTALARAAVLTVGEPHER